MQDVTNVRRFRRARTMCPRAIIPVVARTFLMIRWISRRVTVDVGLSSVLLPFLVSPTLDNGGGGSATTAEF